MKDLLSALGVESLSPPRPLASRTRTAPGYPPRRPIRDIDAPWSRPLPGYDPSEYTADVVFKNEGIWADSSRVQDVPRKFLTRSNGTDVAVPLDERGRPLNPLGRTGLQGRGLLGRWGRNQAGDPLLTRVNPETGQLQLLVIERKDSGQLALPGGMVDEGEDIRTTVARELREETGAKMKFDKAETLYSGIVDDPRNTDNAWIETTVLHQHLSTVEQSELSLQAGDDAKSVYWVNIDQNLLSKMYASHADYVRLALAALRSNPDLAEKVGKLLDSQVAP